MDPYKLLGISSSQVKHDSDLEKVRQRAKTLFKRHTTAGSKFDAKKVLEAFDMIKQSIKGKIGEGQYKLLGRSRKERELDRHFNHQTKEIKKNKGLKRALKHARHGTLKERIHLPGDKERIPRERRRRDYRSRRRRRRERRRQVDVNILEGLNRLAAFLPKASKFPKVVKLLHRWMKEYMNVENREYVFKVLDGVANCEFLLDDAEARQDVIMVFEYVLGYFTEWFEKGGLDASVFGRCWQVATLLACRCFTDDAFVLSSTIAKLNEAMALLEKHKDIIGVVPQSNSRRRAKKEEEDGKKEEDDGESKVKSAKSEDGESLGVKSEAGSDSESDGMKSEASFGEMVAKKVKSQERVAVKAEVEVKVEPERKPEAGAEADVKVEAKPEAKAEDRKVGRPLMSRPLIGAAAPVAPGSRQPPSAVAGPSPASTTTGPSPLGPASPSPLALGSPSTDAGDDLEVLSSGSDANCVDVGSDDDILAVDSGNENDDEAEEIDIGSSDLSAEEGEVSSEGEVVEMAGSIFATPPAGQSLNVLRQHFVERCMATLFQQRGPMWARPKIDAFFQDIFYRRSIFTPGQQMQVEAWQSRIKTNQRSAERVIGEANNPLEAHRPVVDSREMRTVLDADSNTWAAKQTFDSRESNAGRVIR